MMLLDRPMSYISRVFRLRQHCRCLPDVNGYMPDRKALFIHVPKAAGTSVSTALFGREVGHLPVACYKRFLDDEFDGLFKFSFVRNPWDRLVSAYTFLQQGGMPAYSADREFFARKLSRYRDFDEFTERWLTRTNVYSYIHFYPQSYFLVAGGKIAVDYIGRVETIGQDFQHVADVLGSDAILGKANTTGGREHSYRESYTPKTREIVRRVYREDIERFSYEF